LKIFQTVLIDSSIPIWSNGFSSMARLEGRNRPKGWTEMWTDNIRKPPSLTDLFRVMRPRSELHGLKVRDLRTLLKSLHEIAERKLVLEALAEYSRRQVPQRRREREAFSTLRGHLNKACGHIQMACQELREQLLEVEARLPQNVRLSKSKSQIPWERYFSRKRMPPTKTESESIADYLMAARNFAQECADLRAAAIYPSLRTRSEKKLAKRWLSGSGASESEGYPLIGVSTPAIDL
jgi:hypothetical protein